MSTSITIEVAYALPQQQYILPIMVEIGTTAAQAVQLSGILQMCPELNSSSLKLGIYGALVKADTILKQHDRVEIYRPLLADPKEARRRRAQMDTTHKKKAALAAL
ncbi:RnfH family protein [Methylobacillus gramineus]|uniref:RnfH family protein n=1 Tax=Methylobacillus gramineus TaxID=755169 RepID=UPI001CFFC716|nr:RnfH family protein [Methylobacillus gramineus]MCB5183997.1 RnfH family protein [Methylobacillus gramineus]